MNEGLYIVFIDPSVYKKFDPKKYISNIQAKFDFINAYGIQADQQELEKLENLSCVSAISIHTNVICTEIQQYNSFFVNPNSYYNADGAVVAIIDSGIFNHLDFVMPNSRIIYFKDFVNDMQNNYDDNGHGTAVAGIIGGSGVASGKQIIGVANGCGLVILKAIKSNGEGSAFNILEAMQWIYDNHNQYNISVVCMSFGSVPLEKNDPLELGAEALWNEGITVVASAGNNGPNLNSIRSPGSSKKIITVGGSEIDEEGVLRVPDFSSRGPVGSENKPDIVAPATNVICCGNRGGYLKMSGTSFAAPYVAGICAFIKSKFPEYTPDKIKELLLENATDFCGDRNVCGRGLINTEFLSNF